MSRIVENVDLAAVAVGTVAVTPARVTSNDGAKARAAAWDRDLRHRAGA